MAEAQPQLVLVVLALLWAVTVPILDRGLWLRGVHRRLGAGSALVPTPRGPVEVGLAGEGPPVLVLHGAPGGYDRGLAMAAHLVEGGMRVIAPSRPGYLRTPRSVGPDPERTADALAAVLDALGEPVVGVYAAEHGGPTALAFALRHPQRVRALVMESAFTHPQGLAPSPRSWWTRARSPQPGNLLDLAAGYSLELLARVRPGGLARLLARSCGRLGAVQLEALVSEVLHHPEQVRRLRALPSVLALAPLRRAGALNDLEQLCALPDWPLGELQVPVLVAHGALDLEVELGHAENLANRAPHAEVVLQDTCGHWLWLGGKAPGLLARELAFLWQHSRPPPE